jgi:hypothetical protein
MNYYRVSRPSLDLRGGNLLMEKLLSSAAEFLNVKPFLRLQVISRTTATATPMATNRRSRTVMTIPAIAPSLRPLLALLACSPCSGGGNVLVVVEASLAELSAFNEEVDSLIVDDIVVVAIVGKVSKIDTKSASCTSYHGIYNLPVLEDVDRLGTRIVVVEMPSIPDVAVKFNHVTVIEFSAYLCLLICAF